MLIVTLLACRSSIADMGFFGPTSSSTSSSSAPQNRTYKVYIDYEGRCHEFEFVGKEEVRAVKERISRAEGIEPDQQILEYKEQVCPPSTILLGHNIYVLSLMGCDLGMSCTVVHDLTLCNGQYVMDSDSPEYATVMKCCWP